MRVAVEDSLRAEPPSLSLVASASDPSRTARVRLVTRRRTAEAPALEVRASPADRVHAQIVRPAVEGETVRGEAIRGAVDVRITTGDDDLIRGAVEVLAAGKVVSTIPITCEVRRPFRLSTEVVEVAGGPGQVVSAELFYEAREPAWTPTGFDLLPDGVEAAIEDFGGGSKRIALRVRMGQGLGADDSVIELKTAGSHRPGFLLRKVCK